MTDCFCGFSFWHKSHRGAEMSENTKVQLRPHVEEGRGLWLWVVMAVVVVVSVLAAVLKG